MDRYLVELLLGEWLGGVTQLSFQLLTAPTSFVVAAFVAAAFVAAAFVAASGSNICHSVLAPRSGLVFVIVEVGTGHTLLICNRSHLPRRLAARYSGADCFSAAGCFSATHYSNYHAMPSTVNTTPPLATSSMASFLTGTLSTTTTTSSISQLVEGWSVDS